MELNKIRGSENHFIFIFLFRTCIHTVVPIGEGSVGLIHIERFAAKKSADLLCTKLSATAKEIKSKTGYGKCKT